MNYTAKTVSTEEEIRQVASMQASSPEQNAYLKHALEQGQVKKEDCYIFMRDGQVAARAVMLGDYFGLYTVENIDQPDADRFVSAVLQKYHGKALKTDLYSDKKNYKTVLSSLLANGFADLIHKESYIMKPSLVYQRFTLTFRPAGDNAEHEFEKLFMSVAEDNLDSTVMKEIRESGLSGGSKAFFMQLKQVGFDKKLWVTAYADSKPVGFVIVQKLTQTDAGIGYIGVLPKYRGKHFSHELLLKAESLAFQSKAGKLIADIDVANKPIRGALLNCGFSLDCTETVQFRDAQ